MNAEHTIEPFVSNDDHLMRVLFEIHFVNDVCRGNDYILCCIKKIVRHS